MALGAEVAGEAFAKTRRVVADTTTRAVTALLVTITKKHIGACGALLKGAVGTAEAEVAHASYCLHGIPRSVVSLLCLNCKLLLCVANTPARAIVGANSSLTRDAFVILETLALSGFSVAKTFVGALNLRMCLI